MAIHSSILAWKIPWTKEPGGLYSSWGHSRKRLSVHMLAYLEDPEWSLFSILADMSQYYT